MEHGGACVGAYALAVPIAVLLTRRRGQMLTTLRLLPPLDEAGRPERWRIAK